MGVGSARTNAGELGLTLLKLESPKIDQVEAEAHTAAKKVENYHPKNSWASEE